MWLRKPRILCTAYWYMLSYDSMIRCESSQAKRLFFVSIHNHLYEKSIVIFVLIASLDAKFMLAARARAAEHARARRGAAAARPDAVR